MKKTIIASLVLAVGLIAIPVQASEQSAIDLDSMTLDELVSLRDEVNSKITSLVGDTVFGAGVYEVGTDIKASSFKLTCYEATDMGYVFIYNNNDDFEAGKDMFTKYMSYDEETTSQESVVVNLKEGQILKTTSALLIEDASTSFWAPEK